jgi:hypothetical protein
MRIEGRQGRAGWSRVEQIRAEPRVGNSVPAIPAPSTTTTKTAQRPTSTSTATIHFHIPRSGLMEPNERRHRWRKKSARSNSSANPNPNPSSTPAPHAAYSHQPPDAPLPSTTPPKHPQPSSRRPSSCLHDSHARSPFTAPDPWLRTYLLDSEAEVGTDPYSRVAARLEFHSAPLLTPSC